MSARIGADDLAFFEDPQPTLLHRVSGVTPERGGLHVLLDDLGIRSTQRLALSGFDGGLVASLWPAELKAQAKYLYGRELAVPMIKQALELGWIVEPAPQLAFRNSGPEHRVYLRTAVDVAEYAQRWQGADFRRIGEHNCSEFVSAIWPWLKSSGYADDGDDAVLSEFLDSHLGKRPVFLRAGLRLRRRWDVIAAGQPTIAAQIRTEVNEILAAAQEPPLLASFA